MWRLGFIACSLLAITKLGSADAPYGGYQQPQQQQQPSYQNLQYTVKAPNVYEEDEKTVWDSVVKGVSKLFKSNDDVKKDDKIVNVKPHVIEVQVPQCKPRTKFVSTVITQTIPVPVTETVFVENVVPSILRQTQYEIQTETMLYTTIFTQDRYITSTTSIILRKPTTITEVQRQTVTSNIYERQTDVVFTPILSVSTSVVTNTAYVTNVIPIATTVVNTVTTTQVSNHYITSTIFQPSPAPVVKATYGVGLPQAPVQPQQPLPSPTVTDFITETQYETQYVTDTEYQTETVYDTVVETLTKVQPQFFTTTEHVVSTKIVEQPIQCQPPVDAAVKPVDVPASPPVGGIGLLEAGGGNIPQPVAPPVFQVKLKPSSPQNLLQPAFDPNENVIDVQVPVPPAPPIASPVSQPTAPISPDGVKAALGLPQPQSLTEKLFGPRKPRPEKKDGDESLQKLVSIFNRIG